MLIRIILILALDSIVCWLGSGTPIGQTVNLSGEEIVAAGDAMGGTTTESREMAPWLLSVIVLGADHEAVLKQLKSGQQE